MNAGPVPGARCGLDTVEIARIEKLLRDTPPGGLAALFAPEELSDAGAGASRAASLAARFAAKEACCKLFPRETALGQIGPADFTLRRDAFGAPQVIPSASAQAVLDRYRVGGLRVSLTHTETSASAIAWADPASAEVPWWGKVLYAGLPFRRRVMLENLRRAFGDGVPETEIRRLAQACYVHFARCFLEFFRLPFLSKRQRQAWIRIENMESPIRAHQAGKGLLLLTGHFGNWEMATVAGISQFTQYRGLFHFLRRPLKPAWLNAFMTWRFRRAGFGTVAARGSLETILELLGRGGIVVFVFDQHAGKRDGVWVDFFGHPASTFRSLAILALNTGAPVVPACTWREPGGSHVLRFEDPLPLLDHEDANEAIRLNTRAYNAALERMILRHPEQWIWMHRRWKAPRPPPRPRADPAQARPSPAP